MEAVCVFGHFILNALSLPLSKELMGKEEFNFYVRGSLFRDCEFISVASVILIIRN